MQWLSNVAVRRPVFASVLILVLVVVGFVGYRTLGVDKHAFFMRELGDAVAVRNQVIDLETGSMLSTVALRKRMLVVSKIRRNG